MTAVCVVLGIVIWRTTSHRPKFSIGPALAPGIVAPQIAIGMGGATLLAPNGSLWVWGYSGTTFRKGTFSEIPSQLGSETDWAQVVTGGWNNTFALKTNGTLWGWGGYEGESHGMPNPLFQFTRSAQPTRIGIDTNWAQIRAGRARTVALKTDGSLWAWGQNEFGEVGDGTTNHFQPNITRITKDSDWKAIAISDRSSFALKKNGTIWAWGANFFDEYWNIDRKKLDLTPRQIDPNTNWVAICVGYYGLFALKTDGTLWICNRKGVEGRKNYWSSNVSDDQSSIFIQFDSGRDWQRIYGFETGLFAVKRDASSWFFGGDTSWLIGLGKVPPEGTKALSPCSVEPWAFDEQIGTTLLLARDGTLWSFGERIGYDETTLLKIQNAGSILGEHWPGYWVRKKLAVNQVPNKIWELPLQMRKSLGQ